MSEKFTKNIISSSADLIGNELKSKRLEKNITLEDVTYKTKINKKYLEAIEVGDFLRLPKGIYGKSFIQEYAVFLGINPKKILEVYGAEYVNENKKYSKRLFVKKISKTHHFLTIPRMIKNSIIIFVIVVCVLYLGYYINNILTPPALALLNLQKDIVVNDNNFNIIGKTDKEAEILINNEMVLIDGEGNFRKDINLKTGLNIVIIEAQKKYSKKRIIKRNIIVK